jgi:hypothetical protein
MRVVRALVLVLTVGVFAAPGTAAVSTYHFRMSGGEEVPPVVTSATGECYVTVNDVANTVSASCTYSGLSSNANNAHIHTGAIGISGPPIVNLTFTAATSGTATVTNAPTSAANVAAIIAGNTYVNIHSVNHGTGEIRGQVVGIIPAVSSWGLLAAAILLASAGTVLVRRKIARA